MPTSKEDHFKYYLRGMYNHVFSDEEVTQIMMSFFCLKLIHIYAHFADLASGMPTPWMNNPPTKSRSSKFKFTRKVISSFQPGMSKVVEVVQSTHL